MNRRQAWPTGCMSHNHSRNIDKKDILSNKSMPASHVNMEVQEIGGDLEGLLV
jgi:hypothetical protein